MFIYNIYNIYNIDSIYNIYPIDLIDYYNITIPPSPAHVTLGSYTAQD